MMHNSIYNYTHLSRCSSFILAEGFGLLMAKHYRHIISLQWYVITLVGLSRIGGQVVGNYELETSIT
jgi:hypothetical protein